MDASECEEGEGKGEGWRGTILTARRKDPAWLLCSPIAEGEHP
jgi:hypothetical protein